MSANDLAQNQPIRLSICIATYRRADFIGRTLDSILPQLGRDVELLVVDGCSPDGTPEVMAKYVTSHPHLRYVREDVNSGIDGDYDKAVSYARGEYCWLMTDDDLLVEGAVQRVLSHLHDVDLVVVNARVLNADLSEELTPQLMKLDRDRSYGPATAEALFTDAAAYLSFIGGVVIRRSIWQTRNRELYYGSLFIHFGVIFQSPSVSRAYIIASPLILIRYGNAMWTARGFEIWMFKWCELVWSMTHFSAAARQLVTAPEPWREARQLLRYRATGAYSFAVYQTLLARRGSTWDRLSAYLVAKLPGPAANALFLAYLRTQRRPDLMLRHDLLRSPHASWLTRLPFRTRHD